jgi:1-acyl-sn-glycerol-3-phosphate acyltransferase
MISLGVVLKRSEAIFYKMFPNLCLELLERYFRVDVEGIENLPQHGAVVLVPNHSGFTGLDALVLSHLIRKKRGRIPRILLHKLWYSNDILETHAERFGFLRASYKNGLSALKKRHVLILFPEAERGNFKPTMEKYQLQDFNAGFVRLAGDSGTAVVPVLIIGAEEAHVNMGRLRVLGNLLPLPLNLFPFPAKWKIKFLEPVHFTKTGGTKRHKIKVENEIASRVRNQMQRALNYELQLRKYTYFPFHFRWRGHRDTVQKLIRNAFPQLLEKAMQDQ